MQKQKLKTYSEFKEAEERKKHRGRRISKAEFLARYYLTELTPKAAKRAAREIKASGVIGKVIEYASRAGKRSSESVPLESLR